MDAALAAAAKQIEREQAAHTASQEKLKQETDRSTVMAEQVALLKDQCAAAEDNVQVLQAQLAQSRADHAHISQQLADAQQQLAQSSTVMADLQTMLEQEQQVHFQVTTQSNEAQQRITQLQQEAADLHAQLVQEQQAHAAVCNENSDAQLQVRQLEQQAAELQSQYHHLNCALAEHMRQQQDDAAERLRLQSVHQQLEEQTVHRDLDSSTAEMAQLRRQLKVAEAHVDTLTSEKSDLRDRLSEWQEEMARLDAVVSFGSLGTLGECIELTQVEQLNSKICSQDERETMQRKTLAQLRQQVAELRAAKDSAEESLAQVTKHDAEVTRDAAVLKQHIKSSTTKLQEMKAALAAAEGTASAQATELQELQSQATAHAEGLKQLLLSEGRLKSQVELLTSRLQEASDHKSNLHKKLSASQSSNAELQEQLAAVQQDLQKFKAEAASRARAEAAISQAVTGMQEEVNEARQRTAAAEAEAADARDLAGRSATLVLEMGRLQDENTVLGKRLDQMADDLKELLGTSSSGLGHSNPRQKIQYHLKLKQELEELRHEATVLLKERFHLQQCIRYLAARSHEPLAADKQQGATASKPCSIQLQPASLAGNVLYSSPMSARNMSICGRGKLADKGTVYVNTTKESFEDTIRSLRQRTMDEITGWRNSCADTSAAQVLAEANVIGSTCTTTCPPADAAKASTAPATSGVAADDCVDAAGVVVEEQQLLQTPVAGKSHDAAAAFQTPQSSFSADRSRPRWTGRRASFDGSSSPAATAKRGDRGGPSPSPRPSSSSGTAGRLLRRSCDFGSSNSPIKAHGAGGNLFGGNNSILSPAKQHELGAASRPGSAGHLLTPTPARNAAATVEDRILRKIAAVKGVVFVTAAGPPSRLYALRTKTGARLWEFKAANSSVVITDLAAPAHLLMGHGRAVFVALTIPSANSSWVQALDVSTGHTMWQSDVLQDVQLKRLELYGSCRLLATSTDSHTVLALNASTGQLLWQQESGYCPRPSPVAQPYAGEVLLPSSCLSLSGLAAVNALSGQPSWGRVVDGRLDWVLPVAGSIRFPDSAQQWGMAPLLHQGLAIFVADSEVLAVDDVTGRVAWTAALDSGEAVHAWLLPSLDAINNLLLIPAQQGANKTAILALSVVDGRKVWHKVLNGTGQRPAGFGEAQQLLLSGDSTTLYVEACKGRTCCLRALDVLTGKQKWGMCLAAEQGSDATHPHAQFAIWLVTLITIGSICLLILGACLVYVHRWRDERALLYGDEAESPRHTYRPLPDRGQLSDSDGEEPQGNAPPARPGSFITYLRQAQAAEHRQHGITGAAALPRPDLPPVRVGTAGGPAATSAATAPSDGRQSAWMPKQDQ
eukprot:gene6580-6808_t